MPQKSSLLYRSLGCTAFFGALDFFFLIIIFEMYKFLFKNRIIYFQIYIPLSLPPIARLTLFSYCPTFPPPGYYTHTPKNVNFPSSFPKTNGSNNKPNTLTKIKITKFTNICPYNGQTAGYLTLVRVQ